MAKPDSFADRAASIFGALGGVSGAPSAWQLDTQQGFNPGAEDALDRGDTSEEEGEDPVPQPLPGAAGSDDEEAEANYSCRASVQYRQAFERELEEDEFDRLAAGNSNPDEARPLRSMKVLDDNALDRMHRGHHHQQQQQQEEEPATAAGSSPAQHAAAAAVVHASAAPAAMDIDQEPPPLEVSNKAASQPAASAAAAPEQTHQGVAKRHRPAGPGLWVPPHRRTQARDSADPGSSDAQQQQQQQRRVRFASEQAISNGSRPGSGQQQQQQQQQRSRGDVGQRSIRGRGWRGGRHVPDHVKHPHKYTVYTLDEPLYVGQGGRTGDTLEDEAGQRAASRRMQQQQQRVGGSSSSSVRVPAGMMELDTDQQWQQEEGPILLSAPPPAAAAAAELSEAQPREQLPAAGTIKFAPSSKRQCIEPAAAAPGAGKQTKPAVAAAAGKGAFLQDVDDTAAMEVHQRQSTAATAGAAVGIHNRTAGAGRGKRNLRQKVGDDRVQDE